MRLGEIRLGEMLPNRKRYGTEQKLQIGYKASKKK